MPKNNRMSKSDRLFFQNMSTQPSGSYLEKCLVELDQRGGNREAAGRTSFFLHYFAQCEKARETPEVAVTRLIGTAHTLAGIDSGVNHAQEKPEQD